MSVENPLPDDIESRQQAVFDHLLADKTDRVRQAITLRFGLGGHPPLILDEAAEVMGCTRSNVGRLITGFQDEVLWDLDFYKLNFPLADEALETLDTIKSRFIKTPDRVRIYLDALQAQLTIQSPEVQSLIASPAVVVPEASKKFPWRPRSRRSPSDNNQIYLILDELDIASEDEDESLWLASPNNYPTDDEIQSVLDWLEIDNREQVLSSVTLGRCIRFLSGARVLLCQVGYEVGLNGEYETWAKGLS